VFNPCLSFPMMMTSLPSPQNPLPLSNASAQPAEDRGAVPAVTSQVLPWLSKLAYQIMSYGVLPRYFRKITIRGQEHLPTSGAVILAPMHRSRWDAIMVPYATGRLVTGRDVHFMVSVNEMKGVQGWLIRRLGGFPVNSDQPGRLRALASSVRHGVELLCQRNMMVVFPEGNIYREGALKPLKTGIAHMALQATQEQGVPVQVVPVGLAYDHPYPGWGSSVVIHIAPPLSTAQYLDLAPKQAVRALTADLTQSLLSLNLAVDLPPGKG
jgi:1-acyl-sn-glycerol-3-phosphate acyltransferase